MSIFRTNHSIGMGTGRGVLKPGCAGLTVKCPKCHASIPVLHLIAHEPLRCARCHYPMIRNTDLRFIVDACRKLSNANQVDTAVSILRSMVEYYPEAGTALGELASQYPLPMSENEKWTCLNIAYNSGDEHAGEWLNLMCQTSPEKYMQCQCKSCGAPKYIARQNQNRSVCRFCQSTD